VYVFADGNLLHGDLQRRRCKMPILAVVGIANREREVLSFRWEIGEPASVGRPA